MSTRHVVEEKCDRCGATQCSDAKADVRSCFVIEIQLCRDEYVELCSLCLNELKVRMQAFMEEKRVPTDAVG